MAGNPTKVLLVDDDEEDAFITEELLEDAPGNFDLKWMASYDAALKAAQTAEFDAFLVDYKIGGETGIEFLENARALGLSCPMILLTGVGQHEIDVAASEVGAADFLDKASLTPVLLERTIRYAIAHASALQDLDNQRQLLTTTLESLQGGILAFDAAGQPIAANQRFEILMRQIGSIPGADDPTNPVETAREILGGLDDLRSDQVVPIESHDGKAFEIRVSPMPGRGNVFLIVDTTEQKVLQRKILEAKTAAENANTAKSVFLAKVSHELRTPLNGVLGMTQLLKLTELTQTQSTHVGHLEESAKGLFALIEDLLDISMVEQGKFQVRVEPLNLHKLVDDACGIATAASTDTGIEISGEVFVDPELEFLGDGKRIKQILTNFLNNAVKYAGKGAIQVQARQTSDGWVRFMVRDHGKGIAFKDQPHIFERFMQVAPEQAPSKSGVGLGLSIAKELVEEMSGRIGVISAPGAGAEFWFELPLGSESGRFCEAQTA
ncbi:MAG: ATP-binding protein [Planctomycetota bacterium]